MSSNTIPLIVSAISALLSGFITTLFVGFKQSKKEKKLEDQLAKNELKIELKDLQIKLYKLEKDLSEWKDKYYSTLQELIDVKSELEETLLKLSFVKLAEES